jgi:hypothetical protein
VKDASPTSMVAIHPWSIFLSLAGGVDVGRYPSDMMTCRYLKHFIVGLKLIVPPGLFQPSLFFLLPGIGRL